ncbi:helix-hairpin-helix domain-containing protein, partial [Candidatus Rickettsia tasmanensis]
NLFKNIEKSKNVSLPRFIYALGIRHIGEQNAKLLAREFGSYNNFIAQMELLRTNEPDIYQKLNNLEGIGDKILVDIIDFLDVKENVELIKKLGEILNIEDYKETREQSSLTDKIVVFTGSLPTISRADTAKRPLKYFVYSGGVTEQNLASSQDQLLTKLKECGFNINEVSKLASSEEEIFAFYEYLKTNRENLPYEIDGVVYKLNDFALQNR